MTAMSSGILDQPFGQMMSSGSSIAIVGNSMPAAAKLTNTLLAFFRKMRFMAGHTLPAPVAIDKYIRKAILRMEFSVIAPCPAQPADVREIAIHLRKASHAIRSERWSASWRSPALRGGRSVSHQSQPLRIHLPECIPAEPHLLDLNQRRWILSLTRWAICAIRQ
jgi:hypothetical protein